MNPPAPQPPIPNAAPIPAVRHVHGQARGEHTRLWRYVAIEAHSREGRSARRTGELAAADAAEVRASLRRIGLQVIDVKPLRARGQAGSNRENLIAPLRDVMHRHLRSRRGAARAELYDSIATMLSAGLPLMEAVQTIIDSRRSMRPSPMATMVMELRERLRSGSSLAQAMREHPACFDAVDVAMVEAAQHAGNLPEVLVSMAQRQSKSNELGHKLIGALAYPFLVMLVGIGVTVFLSVKTLPELAKILSDAQIPVPALTQRVMWLGQLLAHRWFVLAIALVLVAIAAMVLPHLARRLGLRLPETIQRWSRAVRAPRVLRTMMVGGFATRLAELLGSGVPMVDAIRVLAPTVSSARLRGALLDAAERIERGEELSQALHDERWFNAEFRRLLDIGQTTGELEVMLQRIGERYQRQSQRLIERLVTSLEPLVILALAALVGTVVMAAVLPLLRLQEILR